MNTKHGAVENAALHSLDEPQKRMVERRAAGRSNRRFLIAGLIIAIAFGYLLYAATQSGSEYYVTTGELKAMGDRAIGQSIRLGGRVVEGTVQRDPGGSSVAFALTDGEGIEIPVRYTGTIPDSFQPNVDVIVEGKLGTDGSFTATSLLAKCASKYTPKG